MSATSASENPDTEDEVNHPDSITDMSFSPEEAPPCLTGLIELYRQCQKPLRLYQETEKLIERGVPINYVDETGSTAISLLVLHINRGLRYHTYRVPKLGELVDLRAPLSHILGTCAELDTTFQEDVYKSMRLLLKHGADCNMIPAFCPGIPYEPTWSENYEHKIMQSDQRWNLLSIGGSMEFTTYSIFNPMSHHRPTNSKGITVLHLAAWRGDALCVKLLVEHGADVHATTSDGRNALHFLYLYCNKPCDLLECTQILTRHGIDVNVTDCNGHAPLFILLNHFLVKRSHVKYLANCYTEDNITDVEIKDDHFRDVIKLCIELLLESGATISHTTHHGETPLHHIYSRFEHSLRNCEPDFQVRGHYLVPYHFRVTPLIEFSRFLIGLGCRVNARDSLGRTPLHHLVMALRNLSLDECLNPTDTLYQCFDVLLSNGANVNIKDYVGKTSMHHLVEVVCTRHGSLYRHLGVMKGLVGQGSNLLAQPADVGLQGADLRAQDIRGTTVLHSTLGSSMKAEHMQELLLFLLQCGADPNQTNLDSNHYMKYPLNSLMKEHIYHHDPLSQGTVSQRIDQYLHTMDIVCRCMAPDALAYVFSTYRESGFWGVICEQDCRVYRLLQKHTTCPRGLKEMCRLQVWRSMGPRFYNQCHKLPIPHLIQKYVFDLVT